MNFNKNIILIIFALIGLSTTAFSQSTENESIPATDSLKTTIVKVKGITCAMDLKTISGNVEKMQGVSSLVTKRQGATSVFELTYLPTAVSENEIFETIENTPGCEDPNDRPYKIKQ